MNKEMDLSLKKLKPFSNLINLDKIEMNWRLFWIKLSKLLEKGVLVANTEESTFDINSQITYSWSRKGEHLEFKNQPFIESLNIVLTILSNGYVFEC